MNIAILGASNKSDRYSYQALVLLKEQGYKVYLIHPKLKNILGLTVFSSLNDIKDPIHTITIYVNKQRSTLMQEEILATAPKRIIFNPGAENSSLSDLAAQKGIQTINACTIVMLKTGQFIK